ncbi:MAG: FAD-binding protein [Gemmatimonadales bacterium]|jgi:electron transfer flavoprotein alpha subunit
MEKILVPMHTDADGGLPRVALEVLAGAGRLSQDLDGADLIVGFIGGQVQDAADSVADCGAAVFLAVEGDEFNTSRYASDAAALEGLVRESGATLVLVPATSRFSRTVPGVTQRVDGRIDTHVTGLSLGDGGPHVERWYYRQRMVASLSRTHRPWFILIDAGVFEPWGGRGGTASLEKLALAAPAPRTRVVGEEAASAEAQTIRPDADLLFVAGAGWTKKQADGRLHIEGAERLIREFLEKAQASLGSSKSLVDQSTEGQRVLSFMSHMNQVGQTGSTPRHPKGLATCCHGEEPHVVGWRFIKERRAVNLDPACGWAQGKADVLYVADAFAVMAKVNELLGSG